MSELEKEITNLETSTVTINENDKFNLMQRKANLISKSIFAPAEFSNNIANCYIAVDIIERTGLPIMTVLQNLYIIYKKPSFSSKFLIAMFNNSKRFTAINYEVENKGLITAGKDKQVDNLSCRAYTTELATGKIIYSPEITIETAIAEGWYHKNGSKWQTIPELMLRYRSASFLINTVAPELTMGIQSMEEVIDVNQPATRDYKVIKMDDKKDTAEVVDDVEIITNDVDVDANKSNSISVEDFINNDDDEVNKNV